MTTDAIIALQPGPELDRLIHKHVFGKTGRCKTWSTSNAGFEIFGAASIVGGRRLATDPDFNKDRPFWAGTVELSQAEGDVPAYVTTTRVFCTTLPLALCKAALISIFNSKKKDDDEE